MATAASLTALEWMARSYAPALLTVLGRAAEAGVIGGSLTINSNARMNQVTTRLNALEADCWAEYVPAWDPFWPQAGEYVFDQVIAQNTTLIATINADPDTNAKGCMKSAFRALEMATLRFLAGGGVLT